MKKNIITFSIIIVIATIIGIIIPLVENTKKNSSKKEFLKFIDSIESLAKKESAPSNIECYKTKSGWDSICDSFMSKTINNIDSGMVLINNQKIESASVCIKEYELLYDGKDIKINGKCNTTKTKKTTYYYGNTNGFVKPKNLKWTSDLNSLKSEMYVKYENNKYYVCSLINETTICVLNGENGDKTNYNIRKEDLKRQCKDTYYESKNGYTDCRYGNNLCRINESGSGYCFNPSKNDICELDYFGNINCI